MVLTREDKQSGRALSMLGFGCMRFPTRLGTIDEKPARALILRALDAGINYFDTAYIYHNGMSEGFLGKVLREENARDKVYVATKLPHYLVRTAKDIDKLFETQLKRLQTGHIDYYLMHMLQDEAGWKRLCALGIEDWIEKKRRSGQIGQIGFSFHGNAQEFIKILNGYPWQFTQIQYNYLDENTQAGKGGLMAAAKKDIPVMCMEPLRGGRLVNQLPKEAVRLFESAGHTPADWALRWVWNHPEITVLLSGMSTMEQLEQNLETAQTALPHALTSEQLQMFKAVRNLLHQSIKVNCTGCGYCMPCPQGVDIPTCFALYNEQFTTMRSPRYKYIQATAAMSRNPSNASRCIGCGKCEKHCPQHLPIREKLRETAAYMEKFPFKLVCSVGRQFMGKKIAGK